MRLIYLGTPEFAVPTLEAILGAEHEVVMVVTQPDRPKGRGHELVYSPVKLCALRHNLTIFQPERIRRAEAIEHLRELRPEIMAVVGYGQILPQAVIDIAPRGIVNVHASLLPRLRGAAPIQWAVANGDAETGVTTMQIDAGLDTGAMLLRASTRIEPEETSIDLSARLAAMGADLLLETLRGLESNSIVPEPQDDALATYAPTLKKEGGRIDWNRDAQSIHDQVRGFQPWPGAYTAFRGELLHIWATRPLASFSSDQPPGTIALLRNDVLVTCGGGSGLKLLEVQLQARKRLAADEFVRGQRVADNERLGVLLYP